MKSLHLKWPYASRHLRPRKIVVFWGAVLSEGRTSLADKERVSGKHHQVRLRRCRLTDDSSKEADQVIATVWLVDVLTPSLSETLKTPNPESSGQHGRRCDAAIQELELLDNLFCRHSITCSILEDALDRLFAYACAEWRWLGGVTEDEVIGVEVVGHLWWCERLRCGCRRTCRRVVFLVGRV